MTATLRLSILDYAPVGENLYPSDGLASTVRLDVSHCLCNEYHSCGLRRRAAAKLQQFEDCRELPTAARFVPNRIDLGFGRAPGGDGRSTAALNAEKAATTPYPRKVADLLGFLTGHHLPGSPYEGMHAHPETRGKPQPFVLGASGSTAEIAARSGLGFTFAHFINSESDGRRAAKAYRAAFR